MNAMNTRSTNYTHALSEHIEVKTMDLSEFGMFIIRLYNTNHLQFVHADCQTAPTKCSQVYMYYLMMLGPP